MPSGVQKQPEAQHRLEAQLCYTSQLDTHQSTVEVSSQLSTQPDTLQEFGTRLPAMLSESVPLHSQTTPTPLSDNSQLSEAVHRHEFEPVEHFVDQGTSCGEPISEPPAVVQLESAEELYSETYMESLLQQEAFPRSPEGQEQLQSDHDMSQADDCSHIPLEVMEIKPLVKQGFHLEQYVSEMLPADETQQEVVHTSSDEESEFGRIHAELSEGKPLVDTSILQQEHMLSSSSISGPLLGSTLQQAVLPDLSSTYDASDSGERHTFPQSGRQSPEGNVATGFFSEMKSELSQIVTLMQVSLWCRMPLSAVSPSISSLLLFPSLLPLPPFPSDLTLLPSSSPLLPPFTSSLSSSATSLSTSNYYSNLPPSLQHTPAHIG